MIKDTPDSALDFEKKEMEMVDILMCKIYGKNLS